MTTLATAMSSDALSRERYVTREDLAALLETSVEWVRERQREGIICPALTRGAVQYTRQAVPRLVAYAALQQMFGPKSPIPGRVVRSIEAELDRAVTERLFFPSAIPSAIRLGLDRIHTELRAEVRRRLAAITDTAPA